MDDLFSDVVFFVFFLRHCEKSFDSHGAACAYTVVIKCVITFVSFNCPGFLYHHLGKNVMCLKCFPFLYNDCFELKVS